MSNREEHDGEVRRFERRLPHRPEKVWRALTTEGELAKWFPARIERREQNDGGAGVELEEGAKLRFVFYDGSEPEAEGEITRCEPPHVLTYTMGDETLQWELVPIPEGTLLVFTTEVRVTSSSANDNAVTAFKAAA